MRRNLYPWVVGFAIGTAALIALLVWRMPEVAAWSWYARSGRPAMTGATVSLARQSWLRFLRHGYKWTLSGPTGGVHAKTET
jgi:hypothetical protein